MKLVKDMNRAMMAKLAWRELNHSDEAWSSVLRSKYAVNDYDGIQFKSKCIFSQVCKGILLGAGLLRKGIK